MPTIASSPQAPDRPGRILARSLWFALAAAVAELVVRLLSATVFNRIMWYGPNTIWMTPLAYTILFLAFTLLLLASSLLLPYLRRPGPSLYMVCLLAAASQTFQIQVIDWWARLLLAVGLAFFVKRFVVRRLERFDRLVRRTLPAMVVTAVLAGIVTRATFRVLERRRLASLPAARAGAPNVLFLIFDTVRASSLSLYGSPRRTTPRLEAVASRGVTFDRAIAPASYTLPSHASFFSGRWPRDMGIDWFTGLPDSVPVVSEALASAGYRTAGFSGNRPYVTRFYGFSRGFAHWVGYSRDVNEVMRNTQLARTLYYLGSRLGIAGFSDIPGRRHARQINREILEWLARSGDRPYFVFANYFDAHEPYLPPAPCDTAFGWFRPDMSDAERRLVRSEAGRSVREIGVEAARHREAAYDGAISCLDADLGRLVDTLTSLGRLDNTVIVISSDHGEEFGEHGVFSHGNSLYMPSLHVPLVVVYPPAVPAGLRVTTAVTLRDIPATILDLAGAPGTLPGQSLRRQWLEPSAAAAPETVLATIPFAPRLPAAYPISKGDMVSVVTDQYQYIRDGQGSEEVFDLTADPEGSVPVADSTITAALRKLVSRSND